MISHLVFVMNIISHVQTLILYIVSLMPVSFACRDYLRTPFIETVDKINRHWQVCTFTFNKKLFSLYSKLIFSISRISIVQLRLAVLIFFLENERRFLSTCFKVLRNFAICCEKLSFSNYYLIHHIVGYWFLLP